MRAADTSDPEVAALLHDYISLYARDSLERWRDLFLAGFIATSRNEDGSTTTRSLDEFYARQRELFATGKPVGEVLENTEIRRTGSLASVRADFVWSDTEVTRRGILMLLLIVDGGKFKIQSLTFSYHG